MKTPPPNIAIFNGNRLYRRVKWRRFSSPIMFDATPPNSIAKRGPRLVRVIRFEDGGLPRQFLLQDTPAVADEVNCMFNYIAVLQRLTSAGVAEKLKDGGANRATAVQRSPVAGAMTS